MCLFIFCFMSITLLDRIIWFKQNGFFLNQAVNFHGFSNNCGLFKIYSCLQDIDLSKKDHN